MAGSPLGLLLVLTDSPASVATASGNAMAIILPDEVPTGAQVRVWAEGINNAGNVVLDAAPQVTIWSLGAAGGRLTDVSAVTMTGLGEAYYYDWTPSANGTYAVQVAGLVSTASLFGVVNVSARPKFDPIALAVEGVLVSRM